MGIDLKQKWIESGEKLFPVLGEKMINLPLVPFDLSVTNPDFERIDITDFWELHTYATTRRANDTQIPFGGYGEKRAIYTASKLFTNPAEIRNIHLGVDLWAAAETPVFAPFSGRIHSFAFNDKGLDYGGTIITEHQFLDTKFYLLFGHLSLNSVKNIEKNTPILGGTQIGELGCALQNGMWSPHLHLQIILDIGDWEGDFPGVAAQHDAEKWLANSPDPNWILGVMSEEL